MPFTDEAPQQPQAKGGFTDTPQSSGGGSTDALVQKYAAQYGVPVDFANRIRGRESGGTADPSTATSSAGARGIYQLMPGTFKEQNVGSDITNPEQNINAGLKYLGSMLKRYNGNQTLAAAAYNAGPGAVDAAHGVPHIAETEAYAKATARPQGGFTDEAPSTPKGHFTDKKSATQAPPPQAKKGGFTDEAPAAPQGPKGSVPFIDAIGKNPLVQGAEHLAQGIVKGGLTAGTNVLGGLDAVLGAPQRLNAAMQTKGNMGAVLHPFDQKAQAKLEYDIQQPDRPMDPEHPGQPLKELYPGEFSTLGSNASAVGQFAGPVIGKLTDFFVNNLRRMHEANPLILPLYGSTPTNEQGTPIPRYVQNNEQFLKNLGGTLAAQWITDPTMIAPFIRTLHGAIEAHTVWQQAYDAAKAKGLPVQHLENSLGGAVKDAKEYHAKVIKPTIGHLFGTRPELDKVLVHDENAPVQGKAARLSIEQKVSDDQELQRVVHEKLKKKYAKEIDAIKPGTREEMYKQLPEEIKQAQLQESWQHGDAAMRADSEARGFHPTEEDLKNFPEPTGAIKYDLRKDYISLMSTKAAKTWKDTPLFQTSGKIIADKRKAGFEQHAHPDDKVPDKLSDRVFDRLAVGRSVIAHRLMNKQTEDFLKQLGGWKGQDEVENKIQDALAAHSDRINALKEDSNLLKADPGKYKSVAIKRLQEKYERAANHADPDIRADAPDYLARIEHLKGRDPSKNNAYWSAIAAKKDAQAAELSKTPLTAEALRPGITAQHIKDLVDNLSFSNVSYRIPFWTQKARQLGRAGIQLNPIPHGLKNVGTLAHLEGGPPTFGAGIAYAVKGLTPEELAWHHSMGLSMDYMKDAQGPVTALANKIGSQEMLTRLEMGYRQALKDHYDALYGPSKTIADDYNKAQKIRNALIDYRNVSRFVSALQAIGGPFVVFRTKLLGTVAKAALKTPGRVESYARAQTDTNQELKSEGENAEFNMGGPVQDAATAATKFGDFIISPATIGPVASAVAKVIFGKEGPMRAGKQMASEVIPATNVLVPILSQIPAFNDFLKHYKLEYDHPGHTSPFNDLMNMAFGSYFGWRTGKSRTLGISAESRGTETPAEPGHYRNE